MQVRNYKKTKYFQSIDSCKITELFGIPTNNLKQLSLALAILKPGKKTIGHFHKFLEVYTIIQGKGIMYINKKSKKVTVGDSILIKPKTWHCMKNIGGKNLCFYCICVPAFTTNQTVMKNN